MMLSTILFMLGAAVTVPPQDSNHPPSATTAPKSEQSVNGGVPQRVDPEKPRTSEHNERWSDGMNTKRAPDPRKRDEYGAPQVTPPAGQGTDNPGGIPEPRQHPPHSK